MQKLVSLTRNILIVLMFCGFLIIEVFINVKGYISGISVIHFTQIVEYTESFFTESLSGRMKYIEIYGGMQNLLGKRQIENFTIFKTSYDKLCAPMKDYQGLDTVSATNVEKIATLCEYLDKKKVSYVYLTSILPVQD